MNLQKKNKLFTYSWRIHFSKVLIKRENNSYITEIGTLRVS